MLTNNPEALARTREIAGTCDFSLEELRYEYPAAPVAGGRSPQAELARRMGRPAQAINEIGSAAPTVEVACISRSRIQVTSPQSGSPVGISKVAEEMIIQMRTLCLLTTVSLGKPHVRPR